MITSITYEERRKIVETLRRHLRKSEMITNHQYRCFRGQLLSNDPNYTPLIRFLNSECNQLKSIYETLDGLLQTSSSILTKTLKTTQMSFLYQLMIMDSCITDIQNIIGDELYEKLAECI